jgi:hypothetical protein
MKGDPELQSMARGLAMGLEGRVGGLRRRKRRLVMAAVDLQKNGPIKVDLHPGPLQLLG